MADGIYVATAGAVARLHQLEVAANNLANADTTGFRAQEVSFQEVLHDEFAAPNRHMVAIGRTVSSVRPGSLQRTSHPMDLAFEGSGYFVVGPQNLLSRSLTLQVGPRGELTDSFGRPVRGQSGPVHVDGLFPVRFGPRGEVIQQGTVVDQLLTVSVPNESGLQPVGYGLLQASAESGMPVPTAARVVTGALEGSNVNTLQSMVQLIRLQRDYQSLSRAINSYREADESLIESAQR